MEKKLIKRYANTYFADPDGRSIEDIIEDLKALQSEGCTHIENEIYDDCANFGFYYFSEETDEEFEKRVNANKRYKELAEKHEREQYEKLKSKYENNN